MDWTLSIHVVVCILIVLICVVLARPWTTEEKLAVTRRLGHLVHLRRHPRKHECEMARMNEAALANRDWLAIKHHIASKVRYARLRDRTD